MALFISFLLGFLPMFVFAGFINWLDRFEKEELAFHRKIRNAYLELAEDDPKRYVVLNAQHDLASTQAAIRERVEKLLKSHGV